jgi:hypothetical protein
MKPRVYMAGKIEANDWRHALVGGQRLRNAVVYHKGDPFAPELALDCGEWIYCGPFFVACDHSCSHAGIHGVGPAYGGCEHELVTKLSHAGVLHQRVFAVNKMRLGFADLVFAYLESSDCYGTLIEQFGAFWRDSSTALGHYGRDGAGSRKLYDRLTS